MGRRPLRRVATFPVRKPWRTIAAWLTILVVLGAIGRNAETDLKKVGSFDFVGAPATEALRLDRAKFGRSETLAVLLEGRAAAIERHGPVASSALERIPGVSVISPWSHGGPAELRINRDKVLVLVETANKLSTEVGRETTPRVRSTLGQTLPDSIATHVTGFPAIDNALLEETLGAAAKAERVAIPLLLIVLLLIFRTPLAAAMPLAMAIPVIVAGSGVMVLINAAFAVDVSALSLLSLVGLALGVDYSLLVVSRFREELARLGTPGKAAELAMATAGRTVAFAGMIVAVAMVLFGSVVLEPATYSSATAGAVASLLSLALATTLLPAILTLAGPAIDKWRIGRRSPKPLVAPAVRRLIRRPGIVSVLVLIPLLLLAVPALALKTGPPHVNELRSDNPQARDFRAVMDAAGAGWASPFEILATSRSGPVTAHDRLAALARAQWELKQDPDVVAVIGPGRIYAESRRLFATVADVGEGETGLAALSRTLRKTSRRFAHLRHDLAAAETRSAALGSTALAASANSNRLGASAKRAAGALASLSSGLEETTAAATSLSANLGSFEQASHKAASVAASAEADAGNLASLAATFKHSLGDGALDLGQLAAVPAQAEQELEAARDALAAADLASKSDPQVAGAIEALEKALAALSGIDPLGGGQLNNGYYGLSAALEQAQTQTEVAIKEARNLSQGSQALATGVGELTAGQRRLKSGAGRTSAGTGELKRAVAKVSSGGARLQGGMGEIAAGSDELGAGLGRIGSGAGKLRRGLRRGHRKTAALGGGLDRAADRVSSADAAVDRAVDSVDASRVAESGYATLAAIMGTSPQWQRNANHVINASRGADAARLFVFPRHDVVTDGAGPLGAHVRDVAEQLDRELGEGDEAAVGGRAAMMTEWREIAQARRLPLIIGLSVVAFIFLIVVFRSLLLPAKAVILNLLVVGAAFGVVALLVEGDEPFLGGPGWMDLVSFFATYGIVFALSIDYEIFMINRMREGYLATGSNDAAIEHGVEHTARVVTGAAAVMIAVFVAFAVFGAAPIRQLGLALSVAVAVDATIIRLVLLPATMRLFGKANWWLPAWLERRLPQINA